MSNSLSADQRSAIYSALIMGTARPIPLATFYCEHGREHFECRDCSSEVRRIRSEGEDQ